MTRRTWAWGLSGLCILALAAAWTAAQEKKPGAEPKKGEPAKKADEPKKPEDAKKPATPGEKAAPGKEGAPGGMDEEAMKKMMELGSPGEAHQQLNFMAGKWTYEVTWQMAPDAPAQTSKGASEMKWILDGRVLQQDVAAPPDMPNMPPMKGLGLYGYDNMKKEYWAIWMDNMSTGAMMCTGTYDGGAKTLKMAGEGADPMTGNLHQKYRTTAKSDGEDKFVYEMFTNAPDGKEYRCMQIVYTRAK